MLRCQRVLRWISLTVVGSGFVFAALLVVLAWRYASTPIEKMWGLALGGFGVWALLYNRSRPRSFSERLALSTPGLLYVWFMCYIGFGKLGWAVYVFVASLVVWPAIVWCEHRYGFLFRAGERKDGGKPQTNA